MNKKTSYLIVFLSLVAAFLAGSAFAKIKSSGGEKAKTNTPTPPAQPTLPPFNPKKTAKPEIKFFVMSFCPYGNQAEAGLEPVYRLLKEKIDWQPRYIVNDQKASCEQSCPYKVFNDQAKVQCEGAIKQGQVASLEACQKYFPYTSADDCLKKECAGLKAGEYASLHGVQELNQDVREICAFQQSVGVGSGVLGAKTEGLLDKWWKFVAAVNSKCTADNADTCWKEQARVSGLEAGKIAACSQSQAKTLLTTELAEAEKFQASGSPTIIINGSVYNGGRSPEDYKKAICLAFEAPPEECQQSLGQETATSSGGCGQ